ncbi:MAG: ABC transporter substrate-binding protein [Dehalococcoidia bacterium]|nr:ABC transporter substrate-binding protein [Dehalococcoidia bacterium]
MRTAFLTLVIIAALALCMSPACVSQQALPAEIPIGCVLSLTSTPTAGPNLVKAAQLAVDEINERGGLDGKKLRLVIEDQGPSAATALYAIHKLVEEQNVQVIVGCDNSEAVMTAGPYLESKGVLLISPSATSSALSGYSWSKWTYRTCPSDSLQGGVVSMLIKDRGYKKVAILVQDTVYGKGIETMARDYLKGDAEIVASLAYDPAKLSYLSELNTIKEAGPDCVLHVGLYADGSVVYAQALKTGLDNLPWITVNGSYDMPLDKYLDAAKFMEKAVTGTVPVPDKGSVVYKAFAYNFNNAYQFAPTVYCDNTYDSIKLIALALQKANTYNGGAIRDALLAVGNNYVGASGSITFSPSGERIAGSYGIWKVVMKGTQYQYTITDDIISLVKPE